MNFTLGHKWKPPKNKKENKTLGRNQLFFSPPQYHRTEWPTSYCHTVCTKELGISTSKMLVFGLIDVTADADPKKMSYLCKQKSWVSAKCTCARVKGSWYQRLVWHNWEVICAAKEDGRDLFSTRDSELSITCIYCTV